VGDVVADYGAVLEEVNSPTESHMVHPESKLPYPKPVIEAALKMALQVTTDTQLREHLKVGLICLEDFVPDAEVASHPYEQNLQEAKALARQLGLDFDRPATQTGAGPELAHERDRGRQRGRPPRRRDGVPDRLETGRRQDPSGELDKRLPPPNVSNDQSAWPEKFL
jgi:hypothetical protein